MNKKDLIQPTPTLYGEDAKLVLKETFEVSPEQLEKVKERLEKSAPICFKDDLKIEFIPQMYQMISSEEELKWFFEHVVMKPQVNESYSAVFVSRHKKLTKEEQKTIGLTRKESEFLATQTFRLGKFKDALYIDEDNNWTFENFLKRIRRFNVDKYAYTTALGEPIPTKTLAIIFYVNPCDDIKVCREFVTQYCDVNQAISKAMLCGKTTVDNLQSYQWFGNAENNLKHLKANQKGTRYWLDFDIDVPKWFKEGEHKYHKDEVLQNAWRMNEGEEFDEEIDGQKYKWLDAGHAPVTGKSHTVDRIRYVSKDYVVDYYKMLLDDLNEVFDKGNYVIIDTSGGYHVLVKTSAIKSNPHDFCLRVLRIYSVGTSVYGEEPYLDEKGNCKFECIVNDSQIPGIPLPGTYQYDRPVVVLNKEDFND